MKILWITNVSINISGNILGGWLDEQYRHIKKKDIELLLLYPASETKQTADDVWTFAHVKDNKYSIRRAQQFFNDLIRTNLPDLIHIHGTELPHAAAMSRAATQCGVPYIVSIQGIVSEIYKHVCTGLTPEIFSKKSLRDIFFNGSVSGLYKLYKKRAAYEVEVIKGSDCVLGRTEWDCAWVNFNFKNIDYRTSFEPLRRDFILARKWRYKDCKKRRIFISQGANPIKGLHILIDAIRLLNNSYQDISVQVAGSDFINNSLINKLKRTGYQNYIFDSLSGDLAKNFEFTGYQDANQMVENLLNCNVYVQSSTIENSPNSLMEALHLGVPVVASYVGGTPSICDGSDVLFYQSDSALMLAKKIDSIFKITNFGSNYLQAANPIAVVDNIISIYRDFINPNISGKNNKC